VTARSPPNAGAEAGAPNPPPLPKPPNADALAAPKAGAEACPNAGVLEAPKAGMLAAPNAGVLAAPKAGVLPAPNAGALEAPNAGVPDAPNASEPDCVAPKAGALAAPNAGAVTADPPKAGALAAAPKALLALAPNMPTGALDCAGAEAAPGPKFGVLPAPKAMLPLLKPMPVPAAGARNPEDVAAEAAGAPMKVKDEAAAEDAGAIKEGMGKPVVEGTSGVGPVSSATKGFAAPAEPADGDTDMLLSRLRPLPCQEWKTLTSEPFLILLDSWTIENVCVAIEIHLSQCSTGSMHT
jgi:hypothetical protein